MKGEPGDPLIDVALNVTDGVPVDWRALASAESSGDLQVLSRLEQIEALARLHGSVADTSSVDSIGSGTADDGLDEVLTWGPLVVREKVGRGSYGDVYRAWDPRLGREVALKILRRRESDAADATALVAEGHLLARVRHPNVVTVHGADRIDGRTGLWMEFVEGETLEAELRRRGPLPGEEIRRIGIDVASALAAVHAAGLLHRDVKAQNVMRACDGRTVLMDFGAGGESAGDRLPLAGTPAYIAPEVLAGQPASPVSDVYSLGVLLYHLATGSFPVSGRSLGDLRDAHGRGARRLLREVRADLPAELATAIDRAAAVDVGQRYQSAQAFETALDRAADPGPVSLRPSTGGSWRTRRWPAVAAAAGLALAIVVGTVWMRNRSAAPQAQFKALDQVLIGAFENRTGDPKLDGSVEAALARELANSQYVSVAGQDRVVQALALMPNAILTPERAREVCLRDGAIRAFITGSVRRVRTTYTLSAKVVEPLGDTVLATISEEAAGYDALMRAARRLSSAVREKLGESRDTVRASEEQLAQVTTPSLTAVQLYTQAFNAGTDAESAQLARDAVAVDPEFAIAHTLLGWSLFNLSGTDFNEALRHFERAKELAGRTPERERLFILGSYFYMTKDYKQAAENYESLLRLFPDDRWAEHNLVQVYGKLGQPEAGPAFWKRLNTLWPNSPRISLRMAQLAMSEGADPVRLKAAVDRASALLPADGDDRVWLDLVPAFQAWLDLDAPRAVGELQRAQTRPRSAGPSAFFTHIAGQMQLALGRAQAAESLFTHSSEAFRSIDLALAAFAQRDRAKVLRYLQGQGAKNGGVGVLAWLIARVGEPTEAERRVSQYLSTSEDSPFVDDLQLQTARVAVELARGNTATAGQLARDFLTSDPSFAQGNLGPLKLRGVEVMAEALMETGDPARAASLLEVAAQGQRTTFWGGSNMTGYYWLRTQDLLSRAYRLLARPADADRIDRNLSRLLSLADADFDIARAIASRSRSSGTPAPPDRGGSPVRR